MRFSILLPSAEGKQPGGNPLAPDMFDYRASNTFNYFSDLNPERRALIDALQAQVRDGEDLPALFGLKGDHLEAAVAATLDVYRSPLMAAIDRYSPGVMYQAMEFGALPTGAQRRLLENGIIFSGLFGLLRPDDLIPDYRLSMDASVRGIGKVSRYWRPFVSAHLNRLLTGHVVWNLLPGTHEDAWEDAGTYRRMLRVKFFRERDGQRKAVSHGVKELRGALVHFIVTTLAETAEDLDAWDAPGGFEPDFGASELDERGGGTVVFVAHPDWEARRAARHRRRAEAAAPRARGDEDEDDE
ncbi:MAG: YaaA family protein [Rubricoccaceae bacterium]